MQSGGKEKKKKKGGKKRKKKKRGEKKRKGKKERKKRGGREKGGKNEEKKGKGGEKKLPAERLALKVEADEYGRDKEVKEMVRWTVDRSTDRQKKRRSLKRENVDNSISFEEHETTYCTNKEIGIHQGDQG